MDADVGTRIRVVREAMGLQSRELATLVNLDPTVISKIENGRRAVKSVELARIADALRVSPLALLEANSLLSSLPMAARNAGASITRGGAYERLLALSELHVVLADAGIPTSADLEQVPRVHNLSWLEGANQLADWARANGFRDAIGDQRFDRLIDEIEKRLRVDVLVEAFETDSLSGAAITDHSFPLIFVNAKYPISRCLFTLAHELGHLLAGHGDAITLDRELAGNTEIERMANAFAAAFLMPEDHINETLEALGRTAAALVKLTYEFGVSFESLVFRLHNLEFINATGRDELRKIGWVGIRNALGDKRIVEVLGREAVGRLQTRSSLKPTARTPIFLAKRAFEGYKKGMVSIRPLAGLIGEDPDLLLAEFESVNDSNDLVGRIDNAHWLPRDEILSAEDLYAGSPL